MTKDSSILVTLPCNRLFKMAKSKYVFFFFFFCSGGGWGVLFTCLCFLSKIIFWSLSRSIMSLVMLHSFLTLTTYGPVASKGLKCSACVSGGTVILSPLFGVCEKLHALSNWMIWRRNIYFCINASNFFVTILY